jgi:phosphoglycolate phosphatase-like HAD superfamily hydrolase
MQIPQNTRVVIWDLDGTLLDSHGIYRDLVTEIAPLLGLTQPTEEMFQANFHGSLRDSIHAVFEEAMSDNQLDQFLEHFLDKQNDKYMDIENQMLDDALRLSRAFGERGVKQAIVTNRDSLGRGLASPRSIVERTSLKDHIQHIVCGDDTKSRKPDVQVLGTLLDDWSVQPSELMVIGDQFVDAQFALNLGAPGIIVARDGALQHTEHLQDGWQDSITVVTSLDEVSV